jgi:hypothetical protein
VFEVFAEFEGGFVTLLVRLLLLLPSFNPIISAAASAIIISMINRLRRRPVYLLVMEFHS